MYYCIVYINRYMYIVQVYSPIPVYTLLNIPNILGRFTHLHIPDDLLADLDAVVLHVVVPLHLPLLQLQQVQHILRLSCCTVM